jgi:hypothetical protein
MAGILHALLLPQAASDWRRQISCSFRIVLQGAVAKIREQGLTRRPSARLGEPFIAMQRFANYINRS